MVNKMSDTIDRQTTIKKGEKICPKCGRLLMEWIEDDKGCYPFYYNASKTCLCGYRLDWKRLNSNE